MKESYSFPDRLKERFVQQIQSACKIEGVCQEEVIEALTSVPRHCFLDQASTRAYKDEALPIGRGQTISQPQVVALMTTHLYHHCAHKTVLEIGTGSGYQSAILSQLWNQVYTVERIELLQKKASQVHINLGIDNVNYLLSDGYDGWVDFAPYDAVMVTAACREIPESLKKQLVLGGTIIAPVGNDDSQKLVLMQSKQDPKTRLIYWEKQILGSVMFVPMLPDVIE